MGGGRVGEARVFFSFLFFNFFFVTEPFFDLSDRLVEV